ncbi:MAG: hypothetical protein RBU27_05630 [Bacteroidota bacterium]|jgi:hypothetical protein|nr:hypothetical protein [Bacteroidota bacterium]
MFIKKPQHKRFEYTPRYYDPKKDEQALRRRQIKFESNVRRGSNRPLLIIIGLFILVYLVYSFL